MLSFHSSDVGQTARPREREKSNIRTLGRVHKVKSHSLGHECLIKIPPPSPRDNIDRCITKTAISTLKSYDEHPRKKGLVMIVAIIYWISWFKGSIRFSIIWSGIKYSWPLLHAAEFVCTEKSSKPGWVNDFKKFFL